MKRKPPFSLWDFPLLPTYVPIYHLSLLIQSHSLLGVGNSSEKNPRRSNPGIQDYHEKTYKKRNLPNEENPLILLLFSSLTSPNEKKTKRRRLEKRRELRREN
jgi:hypothetical protein